MNKIKLNNNEFEIGNYNKNTYLNDNVITSTANMQIINGDVGILNGMMTETITSIQITHDDNIIYNLSNIVAHIDNINEYLNMDRMNINVNLRFDNVE